MYQAVIFDMDGVILDSEPVYHRIDMETYRILGIGVSEEEHYSYVGMCAHDMWEAIKRRYGLPNTVEELAELERSAFLRYLSENIGKLEPIEGIPMLLKTLKEAGMKLAVASSSPMSIIEKVVKGFGIDSYFDVLVSGDMVEHGKPEPDIFLHAASELDVAPMYCAVVEDSSNGVAAAKKAGMKAVGYRNPNSGAQDLAMADIIIDSFKGFSLL